MELVSKKIRTISQRSSFAFPALVVVAHADRWTRRALAWNLKLDGHHVFTVTSSKRLLGWLANSLCDELVPEVPDLLVVDALLPGRRIMDLLSDLRAAGWLVPFILLSPGRLTGLEEYARSLGNALVMETPFDPVDLRTTAFFLLDRSRSKAFVNSREVAKCMSYG